MKDRSLAKIKKEIAELDEILEKEGIAELPLFNIPIQRGLVLLAILKDMLRPFIVKYTALVNRNKAYVAVDTSKLQKYLPLAAELKRCEEPLLFMAGMAYNHALKLITSGFEDAEEAVFELFWTIKITDTDKETIKLLTYIDKENIEDGIGITVVKDEDATPLL